MFEFPVAGASAPATGTPERSTDMALKPYDVTVNGYKTTLLLSDEDAKRQGLKDEPKTEAKTAEAKKAPAPANKSRTAQNKKA